jgi:hypothetical protein
MWHWDKKYFLPRQASAVFWDEAREEMKNTSGENGASGRRPMIGASTADPRDLTRVILVPSPPCKVDRRSRGLQRKRRTVWRNKERNRLIADVALALGARNVRELHRLGVRLTHKDLPRGGKLVIMVEGTEHGRQLLPLLPGWRLLHMVPGEEDSASEADAGDRQRAVVTLSYAAHHGLQAYIILRATGGSDRVCQDGSRRRWEPRTPLLLDLWDRWDSAARLDTSCRIGDYDELGWQFNIPQEV